MLRNVFGGALATVTEFDSFYTNLWNKGLKKELALEAKEKLLGYGVVLEPFYRHSKYPFNPLSDERDINGAASMVRCIELYRQVAALKDARKHSVSFGVDSDEKAQDAFFKDFLSAIDIDLTIDKIEVRLQAGRLAQVPPAAGIFLTAAQGGAASVSRVDEEANHSAQDNLPAPSAGAETLKGVVPQPLVLNKPERRKHCRVLGKALQADSLIVQSAEGMRVMSLANGMGSVIAHSRTSLMDTTSKMSLTDITEMCHNASKTSRLGSFSSILMHWSLVSIDIANQRRWIEGSLNWEKAIGVPRPLSNRIACPWSCGVPLTLSPEVATTAFRGVPHDTRLSVCVHIRREISGLWPALNLLGKVEAHPCLVNFITRYPFHPVALIELNSFATLSHMTCKAFRKEYPLIAAQGTNGLHEKIGA